MKWRPRKRSRTVWGPISSRLNAWRKHAGCEGGSKRGRRGPRPGMDPHQQYILPKSLELYLKLANYPILSNTIRDRMREVLFTRGGMSEEEFEKEVLEKAIRSQRREGLVNPVAEEPPDVWQERLRRVRNQLTDFHFATRFSRDAVDEIIREVLEKRRPETIPLLGFNPELAPWDLLFKQAERYEAMPEPQRSAYVHHLKEIIVVIIKAMISDQLAYVGIAREFFTIQDLKEIRRRRYGRGRIGGKAAGMLLAYTILRRALVSLESSATLSFRIPESFFIGSDVNYEFYSLNDFHPYLSQKYKSREEQEREYPAIVERFQKARFPEYIVAHLRELLQNLGTRPLIVRSSSLLEDNFGMAFAGKYDSYFCPNQGSPDENLRSLLDAVKRVYASVLSPDALAYRKNKGLLDYDERMAVLIQAVEGERYDRYYFPFAAGVAFSRNPFRWTRRIRSQDGFLRIVAGLGTRAVNRVDRDYPRLVALSHPALRPERTVERIRKYSQHLIDVIDCHENTLKTLPIREVLGADYPFLRKLAVREKDKLLRLLPLNLSNLPPDSLVFTLDPLLKNKDLISCFRTMLKTIEKHYERPVDMEFALHVSPRRNGRSSIRDDPITLTILQCRPLSRRHETHVKLPADLPENRILFRTCGAVPHGTVSGIRWIALVEPRAYSAIQAPEIRFEIARAVGRLNRLLEKRRFLLMGPGRWGTSNPDLGVKVTYADIFNAAALVEIGYGNQKSAPELSFGTHFFQDLVEENIFPIPLLPDEPGSFLNETFLRESRNRLDDISPRDASLASILKVIDLEESKNELNIVLDAYREEGVAFFCPKQ
ncbi:MAG: phosphoenolpyruvate synthase [Candidatus Hydrogenedentota bacterium]|nr:MAG: phosphoenolpyruvate synthase [Candidatus Hydrogenedentota bacterium]